jgi:chromosome segregation ATPase
MSTNAPQQPTYIIPPPSTPNWRTPLLIGVMVLLAASNIYLFTQVERVKTDSKNEMAKLSADLNGAIEKMRIDSSADVQRSRRTIEGLQSALTEQRRAANRAVGQAKIDAQKRVEALQTQVATEEAQQQQAITAVKQTADTATTKLADVSTDVGTVKTDVQSTKSQLEQTIANLKRVTGDVDNHASLIATNGKELDALKMLGERNYSEFTITKSKQPTRVADISVQLKKVDVKRNKFTIAITVDDKLVEKKDRTINEPIQFYTAKARQPDEIVVNQVRKDTIVGYLAIPKVQTPRSGT